MDGATLSITGDGSWLLPPIEPPPAALLADAARWIWDEPTGDCFAALGEVHFRLELSLP